MWVDGDKEALLEHVQNHLTAYADESIRLWRNYNLPSDKNDLYADYVRDLHLIYRDYTEYLFPTHYK